MGHDDDDDDDDANDEEEDWDDEKHGYQRGYTQRDAVDIEVADMAEQLGAVVSIWSRPPPTLAHYSSARSIAQIIASREIRLFNAYTMNDEEEIDHALRFMAEEYSNGDYNDIWEDLEELFGQGQQRPVYVFSLSAESGPGKLDRLSMWRAYGDDGNGVALKFRTNALLTGENVNLKPELAEVVYRAEDKVERLEALAARYRDLCDESDLSSHDLIEAFAATLWKMAPTFKHEAFAVEREWRVIVEVEPALYGEQSSASAISFLDNRPFVPLKLGTIGGPSVQTGSFEGALVGPSRNSRANEALVSAAFMRHQPDCRTQLSKIPYRGKG